MLITKLPGTTIDARLERGCADRILTPMFCGGGLVLSQVCQITGLEGYIIQNWIKRKYLTPPDHHKKYSRGQLCRILNFNVLKDCFTMDQAEALLEYAGVSARADGSFDDSGLYSRFADALAAFHTDGAIDPARLESAVTEAAAGRGDASSRRRLAETLKVMVTAFESQEIINKAHEFYNRLDFK